MPTLDQKTSALLASEMKGAMKDINQEIDEALKVIKELGDEFGKKERRKLMRPAANVLKKAIAAKAPRSKEAHSRYSTAKFNKNQRAKKGSGQIVATYFPGNLGRSIKTLVFRKSADLFVGPRYTKGNKSGQFKGNKVDGYYARFIEFGTKNFAARPFIRPAVASAKAEIITAIQKSVKKTLAAFAARHKK